MSSYQIIVGSMLGGTEYVAEACEEQLNALGHQTKLHLTPNFEEIKNKNTNWLICTSTHGAGDYPDNIQKFVLDLENSTQDLTSINYMIIGIGDRNYDTYCLAAKNIDKLLNSKGCVKITTIKLLDMSQDIDPEDLAQCWITENKDLL
ncbi:flavodoxin domain-containing protein [Pseudocolwellia agarivorans]|uniref:flavodoxin domain-containing protein n=1 Tax=Pseudocolwellia agarivorans TaxID=1911682 RepID=UPI000986199F|nr:flavodoxin domain-containing protein [Pseudocolwellia agarivorans]